MVVKYEETDRSRELVRSQTASVDSPSRYHSLPIRLPQLTVSNLDSIPTSTHTEHKKGELAAAETSAPSPTCSTRSSLFSQEFCFSKESRKGSISTTLTHTSPPQTPKTKSEWDDWVRVDSVPRWSTKRKSSSASEDSTATTLPGVDELLEPQGKKARVQLPPNIKREWPTPSASPEPRAGGQYVYTKGLPGLLQGYDPITRSLNAFRQERNRAETLLPQPKGLGAKIPVRSRGKNHLSPWQYDPYYRPYQQPSPPRDVPPKKGRAKPKEGDSHCNVKYTTEQTDFIRYQKHDMKLHWSDIRENYTEQFPNKDLKRHRQGIQGCYYRQNKEIPRITNHGTKLHFLPNGHIALDSRKVREQGDERLYFGLVYLFPDRAMKYSWVDPESRQLATKLEKDRSHQKEQARREAIARGTWVENVEDNSCACCYKEERASNKGSTKDRNVCDDQRIIHNFTNISMNLARL